MLPILSERRLQGVFFIPTACLEQTHVASVHKNHFLLAAVDFDEYRRAFLGELRRRHPETKTEVDQATVAATYRWDTPEVGAFKFLLNYRVPEPVRDTIMVVGSHSHNHTALSLLSDERQRKDLETCTALLHGRLRPQPLWPFSYPYGGKHSYNDVTVQTIRELGYCCSFGTVPGVNHVGQDLFAPRRVDTNDVAVA